ncbi:MAG: hypothetical protein IMW86_06000 [Hydrogenibacillus sp.]|nr:hypothetical protein [Hydrogenibacillus sp.]
MKNAVREAFQALLAEEPVPAIIVTHDHEEAERLADRDRPHSRPPGGWLKSGCAIATPL